jgi:Cys-rich repeat protein
MRHAFFALLLVGCDGDLRFASTTVDAGNDTRVIAAECKTDGDCSGTERRRCDVAAQRCVECGVTADCENDEVCEASTKQCMRACGDGATCPSDLPFCDPRGFCVCTATSCTSGEHRLCAPSGRCVECTSDAQCPEGRCDPVRGECAD